MIIFLYNFFFSKNSNLGQEDLKGQYALHDLIYGNHFDLDEECSLAFKNQDIPPIIIRQEKTPSPIIVEKYVKKKSPQVIIKEIHVQEPAPPPIKVVEKMEGSQATDNLFANEKFYQSQSSSQCKEGLSGSTLQFQNSLAKTSLPTAYSNPQQPIANRLNIKHFFVTY